MPLQAYTSNVPVGGSALNSPVGFNREGRFGVASARPITFKIHDVTENVAPFSLDGDVIIANFSRIHESGAPVVAILDRKSVV